MKGSPKPEVARIRRRSPMVAGSRKSPPEAAPPDADSCRKPRRKPDAATGNRRRKSSPETLAGAKWQNAKNFGAKYLENG